MIKSCIMLIASMFVFSSCATLFGGGSSQMVTIDSDPQGAKIVVGAKVKEDGKIIMVNEKECGITPIEVSVPRKDGMILVSKEGYETQEVGLVRGMNPWVWGDIIATSPLSTSIDTSTGAYHEYKPGKYMVTLVPEK
ncbi:MAG: PEGA domain-containing protein [Deltaproteobacteria bacterium]|nr:PEGA domain-containing protein [Deltaproteobacteria bacterium]